MCASLRLKCARHSVLRATTGSFFDAIRAGISPASNVNPILISTSAIPPPTGSTAAILEMPESARRIRLMGMQKSSVTMIPISQAENPMISVSALKTRETSRFDAPIARRIPISLVRSSTEI